MRVEGDSRTKVFQTFVTFTLSTVFDNGRFAVY